MSWFLSGVPYKAFQWVRIAVETVVADLLGIGKGVMHGKLIAVVYTPRTYWNQFSLGGICKQE